eukprot:CAMPEP_0201128092 /NCGR_PEP_ID=MMETSP0850-20130426/32589_1 /ASSEMBLY_ACC=CAM_ASM_000622 /TAXON_ID=183588 /ORGANISM="Pseudo-nitzschia fraudulenta, Strain WWA7" /LENGTH=256 /DNA_ID=CAMNT_0047397155 /DNA_START=194 /DNA_END=964 /DNA_ORIENTATION=+
MSAAKPVRSGAPNFPRDAGPGGAAAASSSTCAAAAAARDGGAEAGGGALAVAAAATPRGGHRSAVVPAAPVRRSVARSAAPLPDTVVEYQSDESRYGRGEMHLSAVVSEGDTVVYRTGTWYVDGVLVGDPHDESGEDESDGGTPSHSYELCRIDTIQVVWTHNCEHGLLRGLAVDPQNETNDEHSNENETAARLSLRIPLEDVQFGPEQLIAVLKNVVWESERERGDDDDDEAETGRCSIPLDSSLWEQHDANNDL